MNIFRLSDDPTEAAVFNQDLHVIKIIVEASQLLCNAYSLEKLESAPKTQAGNNRKHSYVHHPLSKWVVANIQNFNWTLEHLKGLHFEFEYRFNKTHFCKPLMEWLIANKPEIPDEKATEQPQCFLKFPSLMVPNDPVAGYRNYYNACKLKFDMKGGVRYAKWSRRETPPFIKDLWI